MTHFRLNTQIRKETERISLRENGAAFIKLFLANFTLDLSYKTQSNINIAVTT